MRFSFPTFTRSRGFQLSPIYHLLASSSQTFVFPLSTFAFLDRVHEGALDVVEKNNADK